MTEVLFALLMIMPFLCIGAWRLARRHSRSTGLAGMEVKKIGDTVRLRSSPRRTVGVVLLVLGVAPLFVLAGTMYDVSQGRPPWSIRRAWEGIIAVTVLAGLVSGTRVALGEGQMVFDHARRVLRWRRRELPFDAVDRIEVRRVEESDSEDKDGKRISYAVWVVLKKDAEELRLRASLEKEERDVAERLAGFVAGQVGVGAVSERGILLGQDEART